MSREEAEKRTFLDCIGQVAWAGAGGTLSGGVMGGTVNTASWMGTMTSYVDDATADQMLLERTTVDFLTRKGGLKITKNMTQEEKRSAVRQAVENVVHKEKAASMPETGRKNIRLTAADVKEYLMVEKTKSIRNAKAAMLNRGEKVILSTPIETREFIGDAIRGVAGQPTKAYGKVGAEMAQDIQSIADQEIDITGWYLELVPNDLYHAYKQHLKAKRKGNIDLTEQDFLNIPDYVDTYDDILECRTFANGDREIILGKKINGYSVIVELLSNKRKSIHFKNMWGLDTETYEHRYGKSTASHPSRSSIAANGPT